MTWEAVLVVEVSATTHDGLWAVLDASSFVKEGYFSDERDYRIVVPAINAGYADLQNTLEDAFRPSNEVKTTDTHVLEQQARERRRSTSRLGRVVCHKGIETTLPRHKETLLEQLRKAHLLGVVTQSTKKRRLIVVPPLEDFNDAADIVSSFREGPHLRKV